MRTLIVVVIALTIGGIMGLVIGGVVGGTLGIGTGAAIGEEYAANQYWAGYKAATDHITNASDAEIVRERGNVYLFVPNYSSENGYVNVYLANNSTWEEPPYNTNNSTNEAINESVDQLLNQTINNTSNESTNTVGRAGTA
jgi:hypothetical protein